MERLNVMSLAHKIYKGIKNRFFRFSYSLKLAWKIVKAGAVYSKEESIKIKSKIISKLRLSIDIIKTKGAIEFQPNDRNLNIFTYEINHNL